MMNHMDYNGVQLFEGDTVKFLMDRDDLDSWETGTIVKFSDERWAIISVGDCIRMTVLTNQLIVER